MASKELLKKVVHRADLGLKEKALVLLYFFLGQPKSVSQLVSLAIDLGVRELKATNLPAYLRRNKGYAILVRDGWEITDEGEALVASWLPDDSKAKIIKKTTAELRKHLTSIKAKETRDFVEESIACFEIKCFRAATVLSWVGAVAVLQDWILANKLKDFNQEGAKKFQGKWKDVLTKDDFGRLQEKDFLELSKMSSVVGKSQHHALEERLEFRNGCGHPNTMAIGENMVAAHIEALILNVYSKF